MSSLSQWSAFKYSQHQPAGWPVWPWAGTAVCALGLPASLHWSDVGAASYHLLYSLWEGHMSRFIHLPHPKTPAERGNMHINNHLRQQEKDFSMIGSTRRLYNDSPWGTPPGSQEPWHLPWEKMPFAISHFPEMPLLCENTPRSHFLP